MTGIDRGYLSRIENERVTLPIYETRQRIHATLGTTEEELIALGIVREAVFNVGPATARADAYGTVTPGTANAAGGTHQARADAHGIATVGTAKAAGGTHTGASTTEPIDNDPRRATILTIAAILPREQLDYVLEVIRWRLDIAEGRRLPIPTPASRATP